MAQRDTNVRAARVLIADDQTLFRSGLARLLDEDPRFQVLGEAVDGADALRQVAAVEPDVVLMDLKMPKLDGIEATRKLVAERPAIKILILTTFDGDRFVLEALRAGACGYVLKTSKPESIAASIMAVMAGERVMASAVADRMLDLIDAVSPRQTYDGLTAREIEILKLLAAGHGNRQIARQLDLSDKTVRNHVSKMYEKLDINDRSQAVLYAVRKGLVEL